MILYQYTIITIASKECTILNRHNVVTTPLTGQGLRLLSRQYEYILLVNSHGSFSIADCYSDLKEDFKNNPFIPQFHGTGSMEEQN